MMAPTQLAHPAKLGSEPLEEGGRDAGVSEGRMCGFVKDPDSLAARLE
mgnify:CR=1 FL=1